MTLISGGSLFFFSKWRFIWYLATNNVEEAEWKITTHPQTGAITFIPYLEGDK